MVSSNSRRGAYLGTVVDRTWWKRYRARGFFARGNGELWMDEDGLHFRRLLTRHPLSIAWREMTGVQLGRWHAGRWAMGRPVLKLDFARDGKALCAGFLLSGDWGRMRALARDLERRIA